MDVPDPSFWETAAKWLWGIILIPLAMLWKKADNSVQKEDFEKHKESAREDIRDLYKNAEADRKLVRDGFDQLSKEIHETHIALLTRMDVK